MVDITKKPYFHHNEAVDLLMKPIQVKANLRLIGYSRDFVNGEQFLICPYKEWGIDFFTVSELYQYSLFARNPSKLPSAFHMWDHLPYAPPKIYNNCDKKFGLGHGLTIFNSMVSIVIPLCSRQHQETIK